MGAQESKVDQPPKENVLKTPTPSESVPSSPILTPSDPRSPSANIARTPMEAILGSKSKEDVPDEAQQDTSEPNDVVNVIFGIDPRSPTVEFNRTPIIVGAVAKEKSTKLQNKNLDNVRKLEIQTTPVTTIRKSSNIVPSKLKHSPGSVASENKRKSFVGLLETNIDFTETDLDAVCQAKNILNQSLPVALAEDVPSNKLKDQMETLQIASACTTELSKELKENDSQSEDKEVELPNERIVEEKVVNVTAQVKDFDKKLTNLIYEDDSEEDKLTLRSTKVKENNRTPLSIRNMNDDPKRIKNRLKVSDKSRKTEISKIPVFKDNHRKIGVQCENTPPTKFEEPQYKPKVSRWDADKTLII
ncbi:hypothetical protein Zmor_014059 [Zophobas morio]|uniref:Uncharacterized protein n=1 Tax=Zophobas morio TaxID=2755281 RepID=A0AA38MG85_9CUCU|nr:hypothetical protein Zmor_014059 [Zophobas morio]